jgi:hypothetical protein
MIENIINFLLSPAYVTGPAGFYMHGPAIVVEPTLIAIVVLSIASLVWVWKDARKRNKSGFITLLFILLAGWPASFIWWFWLRPPSTLRQ